RRAGVVVVALRPQLHVHARLEADARLEAEAPSHETVRRQALADDGRTLEVVRDGTERVERRTVISRPATLLKAPEHAYGGRDHSRAASRGQPRTTRAGPIRERHGGAVAFGADGLRGTLARAQHDGSGRSSSPSPFRFTVAEGPSAVGSRAS